MNSHRIRRRVHQFAQITAQAKRWNDKGRPPADIPKPAKRRKRRKGKPPATNPSTRSSN